MFLVLAATASTAGLFAHPPSGHGSKVHHVSHFPRWRFVFCFQQVDGVTRHAERVLEFAAAILVALVSTLNRSDITWIESNAAKKKKKTRNLAGTAYRTIVSGSSLAATINSIQHTTRSKRRDGANRFKLHRLEKTHASWGDAIPGYRNFDKEIRVLQTRDRVVLCCAGSLGQRE